MKFVPNDPKANAEKNCCFQIMGKALEAVGAVPLSDRLCVLGMERSSGYTGQAMSSPFVRVTPGHWQACRVLCTLWFWE